MDIKICEAAYNSIEYEQAVALRDNVLRKPLGMKFTEEQLQKEKDDHHLVSMHAGEVLACLILTPAAEGKIKMRQVAVDDEHRYIGLGRHLAAYAEGYAKNKGYKKIYCHARDTAVPFYKKLGYHQAGEPFQEIGITHFVMEKVL